LTDGASILAVAKVATECDLPHCFSLTASGERLGEMSAVLTGLTFPAVIFLGRREEEEDSLGDTQIMLLAAFVSLATAQGDSLHRPG